MTYPGGVARIVALLTGWLAGWAVLPVVTGTMPHGAAGAAGVLVAASLAIALAAVTFGPRLLPQPVPALLRSGGPDADRVPRPLARAFDPDTAGRPRPRAPGRAAPPSD